MNAAKIKAELALRAKARNDLKTFLLLKWERYNQSVFLDNWHYDYIAKILSLSLAEYAKTQGQEPITRLMLNMPPSYGKTELIARTFIAWALGRDPKRKIIYISYSDELCKKISNQVRDLIKSSFWQSIFNKKAQFLQDNSSEFVLKEGGGLFVTTLKSAITGFHAHSILIDDPIKVSDMNSKSERMRVNANFKESVLSRLQDNHSNITILMQRLGLEDLCGFLLDEKYFSPNIIKSWQKIELEALNKEPKIYEILDFRYERAANEALFEKRHNKDELAHLKLQMGEDEFSGQYQQIPQASEAGFFEEVHFKTVASYEQRAQNEYIFIDNATSLNSKADNRAIVVVGVESTDEDLERFVVKDCFYGVFDEEMMSKNIIETMIKYPNSKVYIEKEGGGIVLDRLLQKEIIKTNQILKKQGKILINNIIETYAASRKISKVEKIKALKPYYNSGHLVFLEQASGLNQLKKELLSFNPEKPFRKDDCIDALASCVNSEFVRAPAESFINPQNTAKAWVSTTWRL